MTTQIQTWVSQWISTKGWSEHRIVPLAGDGSSRSFYRIYLTQRKNNEPKTGDVPKRSFVLLWDPEWSLSQDYPAHQAYLKSVGIPVPEFYEVDVATGCLVMEDLGDELLQQRILAEPAQKMRWLTAATQLIAQLHGKAFPVQDDLPVATRAFDEAKYLAEYQFTFEHLIVKFLGMPSLDAADQTRLRAHCAQLQTIEPIVFCHRDYHTRNILVKGADLVLIDFQDARSGPPHYDLASLLYDPYVPLTQTERDTLLAVYLKEMGRYPLNDRLDQARFLLDLNRVGFQRMVKAAGSFASFFNRYGKSTHLPYLTPALKTAAELQKMRGVVGAEAQDLFPIAKWIEAVGRKGKL